MIYATPEFVPGQSGYTMQQTLDRAFLAGKASRAWLMGGQCVSVQLKDGSLWKSAERLKLPLDDAPKILTRLSSIGVEHPSSWASAYDQLATYHPRVIVTHNAMFADWPGGAWSEALRCGRHVGRWRRYDIRSAYRWAASLGLPDPATFVVRDRWGSDPGLWRYRWKGKRRPEYLPATLRESDSIIVSSDEIEAYHLPVGNIVRGVTWTRTIPGRVFTDTLDRLPKAAARAYWGRWAAREPIRCWTPKTEWQLPNVRMALAWAWLIVGRVRLRVWEYARRAAHVYVDEIIVPHDIPTGDQCGDWSLKAEYNGLDVIRTGQFRERDSEQWDMQTGVKRTIPS